MPTTYSGDPLNYPTSVTLPSDGDPRTAASVNAAFEGLADRTAHLDADRDTHETRLVALEVGRQLTPVRVPTNRMRYVTALLTAAPSVGALGTFSLLTGTDIDAPQSSTLGLGVRILTVNTAASSAKVYVMPLTEFLVPFQGRTISAVNLNFQGASGHGALPALMPEIALVRMSESTAGQALSSSTWFSDTTPDVATYETAHVINYTTNQNNVIDLDTYAYALLFHYEGGSNALVNGVTRSLSITLTGT